MADKLPKKLTKEPLLDAVFEMRFTRSIPTSSILPGILYDKLEGSKSIEQLSVSSLPIHIRETDPNLRYAPVVRIHWNQFLIMIGDNNVIIGCKMPYPGWIGFKSAIIKIAKILSGVSAIQVIQRYSLKYVDIIPYKDLKEQIAAVNLKVQLGDHVLEHEVFQFRIEIKKEEFINAIQIVSSAEVILPDQKTKKEGLAIDIDTICVTNVKNNEFTMALEDKLDKIHDMNKLMFFSCLSSSALYE